MAVEKRTVVVTLSPLLRDIFIALISCHADIKIVAAFDHRIDAAAVARMLPDYIVVGLYHDETDDIARAFLSAAPAAQVIVISHDGRTAYVHEMRPWRLELTDVSAQALVAAITGVFNPPAGLV